MKVIKSNGETEEFNPQKIRRSLKRAGASPAIIDKVIEETERQAHDGISTKALYRIVFRKLKSLSKNVAGKYHLKNAIMELGPTGFPFEKFVAALLKAEGFQSKTGQFIRGRCVQHEVDVVAERENELNMFECKFHSDSGRFCDIKHALYVYARFLDIGKADGRDTKRKFKGWLVTNTRFSSDARQYGVCAGLGLLSWDFPDKESLRERVDRNGLHPITCLVSLTKKEKQALIDKMIVLCMDLCRRPSALQEIGLSKQRAEKVLEEAHLICSYKKIMA